MVPKLACILEAPGGLIKIPKVRSHPRRIKLQPLEWDTGLSIFSSFPVESNVQTSLKNTVFKHHVLKPLVLRQLKKLRKHIYEGNIFWRKGQRTKSAFPFRCYPGSSFLLSAAIRGKKFLADKTGCGRGVGQNPPKPRRPQEGSLVVFTTTLAPVPWQFTNTMATSASYPIWSKKGKHE